MTCSPSTRRCATTTSSSRCTRPIRSRLFDFDGGHPRGQNKPAELALLSDRVAAFFNHYVKGTGAAPTTGVTAFTQTCPASAPAGGPYYRPDVGGAASGTGQLLVGPGPDHLLRQPATPRSRRRSTRSAARARAPRSAPPTRAPASPPTVCRRPPVAATPCWASPTVTANISITGSFPMIAERLWDVDPSHGRPRPWSLAASTGPAGSGTVDLPAAPRAPGTSPPATSPSSNCSSNDSPYVRTSNGTFSISVSDLAAAASRARESRRQGRTRGRAQARTPDRYRPAGLHRAIRPPGSTSAGVHASPRGVAVNGTAGEKTAPEPAPPIRAQGARQARPGERLPDLQARALPLLAGQRQAHRQARVCSRPVTFRAKGTTALEAASADASPPSHRHGPLLAASRRRRRLRPPPAAQQPASLARVRVR